MVITGDLPVALLIGRTGSGKSETGNTLLGCTAFCAKRAFSSVTTECALEVGDKICVVDTPGLSDTSEDPTVACARVADFLRASGINAIDIVLVIVSATERFTKDLTAGVRLMEAALGEGCLQKIGTVVFTRGAELERDGISAASLISAAPEGLRSLVERCGGRLAILENRDGLSPPTSGAYWAERLARGEELLRMARVGGRSASHLLGASLDSTTLAQTPAASALAAAGALQSAVGSSAVSELDEAMLSAAFNSMLATMKERAGSNSKLINTLEQLNQFDGPPTFGPLEIDLASAIPPGMSVAEGAPIPAAGSKLWLSRASGASAPPRLVVSDLVRFLTPTRVWAGGSISKGLHRLKLQGSVSAQGSIRFRSPSGLTLVMRGPLSLRGPLRAHVAKCGGLLSVDEWLEEGVLRCGLSRRNGEESGDDSEGDKSGSSVAPSMLPDVFCELHGAMAAEEVVRSPGEACAIELSSGAILDVKEGGSIWIDGSSGVQGVATASEGSVLIERGGRLEVVGLAELLLTSTTALLPTKPRILAQVVHTG